MIKREVKVIDPFWFEAMLEGNANGVLMIELEQLPNHMKDDIEEYIKENNITNLPDDGYYKIETLLNYYLEWNGVVNYTHDIMTIIKQATICKIEMKKDI